ncbi:MAG TPA: arginine--tRNA ligase, partial [Atribacteraceae bacterium]|nr:arginine--tRNA ligase [Atribacteraceae bacterium]
MSNLITEHVKGLLEKVLQEQIPGHLDIPTYTVEPARDKSHGDLATNIAFSLSRRLKQSPYQVAQQLKNSLSEAFRDIARIDVAGPGFINFFFHDSFLLSFLPEIFEQGDDYGCLDVGAGERIQVEFVSVNPTGPLHVGHGKCAAFGDSLARILRKAGFQVEKEYYINDAGRQIDMLGLSLEARIRELLGEPLVIPEGGYLGEYLIAVARDCLQEHGPNTLNQSKPERLRLFREYAIGKILGSIRRDLRDFRVEFDVWFSEQTLFDNREVESVVSLLQDKGYTYTRDGALWLKTTQWGDDKDRVLVRENGMPTYFTSDIAYHWNKWARQFDRVIDIWGADHHGYIPRMQASMQALGLPEDFLEIFIVQFVTLLRGGQPERMSTRQGEFVPLRDLIDEVGVDVARYYFLMRDPATHLEFDIEEARKQSMDNPVYYVQYAHARIASIFREAERKNLEHLLGDPVFPSTFSGDLEKELVKKLVYFPEVIRKSAQLRLPAVV